VCCKGDAKAVVSFKIEMKQHFDTKEEGKLVEYVGSKIHRTSETETLMHQTDLIKKIEKYFGSDVPNIKIYETLGTSGIGIVRPEEDEKPRHRSGVGMLLLFLVKHSRSDKATSVRELSKVNDRATQGHFKELLRAIKYVLYSRNRMLKFEINDEIRKNNV